VALSIFIVEAPFWAAFGAAPFEAAAFEDGVLEAWDEVDMKLPW
jgi:hypothetical protein